MASKTELKKFRHDIATLKRKGLLTGVDARSAVPNRKLKSAIKKFEPVLSGRASAVKLSPSGIREYKAMGKKPFRTVKPGGGLPQRVIIPHEPNERVTVTQGKVRIANPAGVSRTILPVPFQNLEQYLLALQRQKVKLAPGEQLAFRFFDNKSVKTFSSMNALINYLSHYESVFDAIEEDKTESQMEIYQNLEIIKVQQPAVWKERPARYRGFKGESDYAKKRRKLKAGPAYKREEYNAQTAERQRDFRRRMSASEKELYKAAARKRAKKSKRAAKRNRKKK
jgi:hypothetical protein